MLTFFRQTNGYAYKNLQRVNSWNQTLVILMGVCNLLGTLKFLKLFRFNNRIYLLALTLRKCARSLAGFGLVFMFQWLSFVQLFYILYNSSIQAYSTFVESMESSFIDIMGVSQATAIRALDLNSPSIIPTGTFVYVAYEVMMIFVLVNMFISIVCDSFKQVVAEIKEKGNELEVLDYLSEKVRSFVGVYKTHKRGVADVESLPRPSDYVERMDLFKVKVDDLVKQMAKVKIGMLLRFF